MGPLLDNGESVKDPYLMAEILKRQYESTFSQPDPEVTLESLKDIFFFKNAGKKKTGR